MDPALIDRGNLQNNDWANYSWNDIYHVGCTFNFHSIINKGLVLGGQILSRRQTVFFLPVDPRDESHRDPEFF